jgi:ADP-heptose:LPS heptosyltransferase
MFAHLQIPYARERVAVGVADAVLRAAAGVGRLLPGRASSAPPARILLLRLERIGDLLMSAGAIEAVRTYAPEARIDLVVGSWNAEVAGRLRGIDAVETLDAPWLARGAPGGGGLALAQRAWRWRSRRYDLAINFEGDIRSHALMALSGAPRRVGFAMAGGGPLLTRVVPHRVDEHTALNAARLVAAAFQAPAPSAPFAFRFEVPAAAAAEARRLTGPHPRYIVVHASGGRAIKQWDPDRFAAAATQIARALGAAIVLTGAPGDQPLADRVRGSIPSDLPVVDLTGRAPLIPLAGVLAAARLVLTGDTGPMHLAAAVGAPVVAVFGPSMPWRYGPYATRHRIVRIDLPCAPCNLIRQPPARCQGHTPDCLAGVGVEAVVAAALALAAETGA